MSGRLWTLDETTMAFVLYFLLEPREVDDRTKDIQQLAEAIGRSANSVAMKIGNISAHDKNRVSQGKLGLRHGSKLDKIIWELYDQQGDELLVHGIDLLTKAISKLDAKPLVEYGVYTFPEGKERETEIATRVNQRYFRNSLLDIYEGRCCLTGLSVPELLVASHIKPWSVSDPKTERLAPSNGLLLNSLHDKAFDKGLITIDSSYKVIVSKRVKHIDASDELLWRYQGALLEVPKQMAPAKEFIEYHNDVVFQG